jgi:hypothetical protein
MNSSALFSERKEDEHEFESGFELESESGLETESISRTRDTRRYQSHTDKEDEYIRKRIRSWTRSNFKDENM